jgi:hypothetical protein
VEVGGLLTAGLYTAYQLDLLYEARIVSGLARASNEVSAWRFVDPSGLDHILPNQLSMLRRAGMLGRPDAGR